MFHDAFSNDRGFYGETMRVFTSLLLAPVGLLNHGDVSFELVGTTPLSAAVLFRVGAGF